jgi:PTH1 family peptidyl-tRNA hydrolase
MKFNLFKKSSKPSNSSDATLIVGLGNIGPEYEQTRHNIGFIVVDTLTDNGWENFDKGRALVSKAQLGNEDVIFAKPTTMMNLSGQAVSRLAQFYKIAPENIWIVYDELDLPLGRIKIAQGGSDNGHNGTISITRQLGHNRFWRFRVGIDARQSREIPGRAYVLQAFDEQQQPLLQKSIQQAADAIKLSLSHGQKAAMQQYNKSNANSDDSGQ